MTLPQARGNGRGPQLHRRGQLLGTKPVSHNIPYSPTTFPFI